MKKKESYIFNSLISSNHTARRLANNCLTENEKNMGSQLKRNVLDQEFNDNLLYLQQKIIGHGDTLFDYLSVPQVTKINSS